MRTNDIWAITVNEVARVFSADHPRITADASIPRARWRNVSAARDWLEAMRACCATILDAMGWASIQANWPAILDTMARREEIRVHDDPVVAACAEAMDRLEHRLRDLTVEQPAA